MNTQTKWTPGPWKVDEALDLPLAVIQDNEHGFGICQLDTTNFQEPEAQANARLISIAPEMAEALREIADAGESGPLSIADIHSIKSTARAILARLEGGVS